MSNRIEKEKLCADTRGVLWDAVLYVPTVSVLAFYGLTLWYGQEHMPWAYLLWFMACFFAIAGGKRIMGRLLLLPGTPVAIEVDKKRKVSIFLKDGKTVSLMRDLRYFKDYAGKSFGLSGLDSTGKQWQFVFHKGQFGTESGFSQVVRVLEAFGN
ncbi:MAG: hypothetical protein Q9M27_02830 [Mariprofundaceae bacterium]|nr:hypothetical protein [Mariprofundaceae bacterium]